MRVKSFLKMWLYGIMVIVITMNLASAQNHDAKGATTILPKESPAPPKGTIGLVFIDEKGEFATVEKAYSFGRLAEQKGSPQDNIKAIVSDLIAGPSANLKAKGFKSHFLSGMKIEKVEIEARTVRFYFLLPPAYGGLTAEQVGRMSDQVVQTVGTDVYQRLLFFARDSDQSPYRTLMSFASDAPKLPTLSEDRRTSLKRAESQPPVIGQGQPQGFLSGKVVFVSGGHGWYWNGTSWITQRDTWYESREDLHNAEWVDYYLWKYFWNAGAGVFTCRESDVNTNMVIVDNGGSGYSTTGTWTDSTAASYYWGTNYQYTAVSATETATSQYTPNIPQSGYYTVYVYYTEGTNRAAQAKYTVRHTGGETIVSVNQQAHGTVWVKIGTFYFNAGSSAAEGSVVLSNQGTDTSNVVIADAVRFGGGMGDVTVSGSPTSGHPRWEEAARIYVEFTTNKRYLSSRWTDSRSRPELSEFIKESGDDAVFISLHTNASGAHTASGTTTFTYSSTGWDGPDESPPGSLDLRHYVHSEIINDIHNAYDAAWTNDGEHTYTTIVEVGYLRTMPGTLTEVVFHDHETPDMDYVKDPKFRMLVARAVYQGVVKYFANRDAVAAKLLPEPPQNFRVRNLGSGSLELSWDAPPYNSGNNVFGDQATGYRVYQSANGYGFANGVAVSGTVHIIYGLTPGQTYYFRVTATNDGGESFPTETLAARVTASGAAPLLIVNGFDRLDRFELVTQQIGADTVKRMFLEKIQTYDYSVQHARAVSAYGMPFDSANHGAVENGAVDLANYSVVVWIGGEQAEVATDDPVNFKSFPSAAQTDVTNYLNAGGRLFLSSSEAAWDLGRSGTPAADQAFLANTLHATYLFDDAYNGVAQASRTNQVSGAAGTIFDGLANLPFDKGDGSTYYVDYPEVIGGSGGATVNLNYVGATTGNISAGIQYTAGNTRLVYIGVPFETFLSEADRNAVMSRVLDFLAPAPTPTPTATPTFTPTPIPTATPLSGVQWKFY
jgi:hypothetical protein